MGLEARTVVLVEKKSATGWMWKVIRALIIMALCSGGVLLFAWHWNGSEMRVRRSSLSPKFDEKYFKDRKSSVFVVSLISLFSPPCRRSQAKQRPWSWRTLLRKQVIMCIAAYLKNVSGGLVRYIWVYVGVFWRQAHICPPLLSSDPHSTLRQISSNAKAAIHLEGESYSLPWFLSKQWDHSLAFQKEPRRLFLPRVCDVLLPFRSVLARSTMRKCVVLVLHWPYISLSKTTQWLVNHSSVNGCFQGCNFISSLSR